MTVTDAPTLRLELSPDPRLLRILRLVASGVASLGEFDLAAVEEVRVAVDELGATLISASTGGPIELTFELVDGVLCVEGRTHVGTGAELEVDPLTDRILDVVATSHEWSTADGVAQGRFEKAPPRRRRSPPDRAGGSAAEGPPGEPAALPGLLEEPEGPLLAAAPRRPRPPRPRATQANEPPTEIRATPASASSPTVGPPGRTITFTGRSTALHQRRDLAEVHQAGRVEHVGAGRLERLEPARSCRPGRRDRGCGSRRGP